MRQSLWAGLGSLPSKLGLAWTSQLARREILAPLRNPRSETPTRTDGCSSTGTLEPWPEFELPGPNADT